MATATATIPIRDKLGVKPPSAYAKWLNGMIMAEPGVGKTHLLGTAVDHPLTSPLLIFDIDGGMETLSGMPNIDVVPVRSYDQMLEKAMDLYDSIEDGELHYKTIGVDTFSELADLDRAMIMRVRAEDNPRLDEDVADQYGYNKSGAHMRRIVRLLKDLPCNIILTSHVSDVQDSLGRTSYYPALAGKLRRQIPGFLDFVGFMRAETEGEDEIVRSIQFQKSQRVAAKQRNCGFDDVELNTTLPLLFEKRQKAKEDEIKENGKK